MGWKGLTFEKLGFRSATFIAVVEHATDVAVDKSVVAEDLLKVDVVVLGGVGPLGSDAPYEGQRQENDHAEVATHCAESVLSSCSPMQGSL